MNSLDRKELRYQRRKKKRENKLITNSNKYADVNNCFVFSKVYDYAKKCTRNVGYKKSTINFKLHMFSLVGSTCYNIKNNCYKVGKTNKFKINERGKIRDIDAPLIQDRLVHKVISNEILIPLYDSKLIYDNGASTINKGFSFAIKRVKTILRKWFNKYGLDGYVVIIDYSKFFESCNHDIIHDIHTKYIRNNNMIKIIEDYLFIGKGLGLGIEIAQREALIYPNKLDKFIINKGIPIIRYMFLCHSYEESTYILKEYKDISDKLHININLNKTKIVPISKCFKFCKWNYHLTDEGIVYLWAYNKTIYRQRRKLKKMIKKNIDINDINCSITCFKAYLSLGNCYNNIKYLDKFRFVACDFSN